MAGRCIDALLLFCAIPETRFPKTLFKQKRGSGSRIERGSQSNFARLEDFEGALPVRAPGKLQENRN